jgi:hypothetical protein
MRDGFFFRMGIHHGSLFPPAVTKSLDRIVKSDLKVFTGGGDDDDDDSGGGGTPSKSKEKEREGGAGGGSGRGSTGVQRGLDLPLPGSGRPGSRLQQSQGQLTQQQLELLLFEPSRVGGLLVPRETEVETGSTVKDGGGNSISSSSSSSGGGGVREVVAERWRLRPLGGTGGALVAAAEASAQLSQNSAASSKPFTFAPPPTPNTSNANASPSANTAAAAAAAAAPGIGSAATPGLTVQEAASLASRALPRGQQHECNVIFDGNEAALEARAKTLAPTWVAGLSEEERGALLRVTPDDLLQALSTPSSSSSSSSSAAATGGKEKEKGVSREALRARALAALERMKEGGAPCTYTCLLCPKQTAAAAGTEGQPPLTTDDRAELLKHVVGSHVALAAAAPYREEPLRCGECKRACCGEVYEKVRGSVSYHTFIQFCAAVLFVTGPQFFSFCLSLHTYIL